MKKLLALIVLLVSLSSCQWIEDTGKAFCENTAGKISAGAETVGEKGGSLPVIGPFVELGAWSVKLGLDLFCMTVQAVTSAPNTLGNESLALIGLGEVEEVTEEAPPVEDNSNMPDPEGT